MTKKEFQKLASIAVATACDIMRPQGDVFLSFCEKEQIRTGQEATMGYTEHCPMKARARIVIPYPSDLEKLTNHVSIRAQLHDLAFHEVTHIIMGPILEAALDEDKMPKASYNLVNERPAYLVGQLAGYAFQRLPENKKPRMYPITDFNHPWDA